VRAFTVIVDARMHADLDRHANKVELVVLPAVNRQHVGPRDFGHASRLIGAEHAAAVAMLGGEATMHRWRYECARADGRSDDQRLGCCVQPRERKLYLALHFRRAEHP
jgi:hypothetical protein